MQMYLQLQNFSSRPVRPSKLHTTPAPKQVAEECAMDPTAPGVAEYLAVTNCCAIVDDAVAT